MHRIGQRFSHYDVYYRNILEEPSGSEMGLRHLYFAQIDSETILWEMSIRHFPLYILGLFEADTQEIGHVQSAFPVL